MKHSLIILTIIDLCLCMPSCKAWSQIEADTETHSSVEKSTEIGIGGINRLDTYLSPQDYHGKEIRLIYDVLRTRVCKWDFQFTNEIEFDYTKNKVKNGRTIAGHLNSAFSMMHRWDNLADGNLGLRLGGMADLYIGCAYNKRNSSNNPAQAYTSLAIGGAGIVTYDLHLWGKTFPLRYDIRLPLCGIMFSPAYGQSYYEIFSEGNYDHNAVFTCIATPSFRQQFSVDIPVGKTTFVRVGYLGDIRQAKPNKLRQHTYSNAFIVGICRKLNKK